MESVSTANRQSSLGIIVACLSDTGVIPITWSFAAFIVPRVKATNFQRAAGGRSKTGYVKKYTRNIVYRQFFNDRCLPDLVLLLCSKRFRWPDRIFDRYSVNTALRRVFGARFAPVFLGRPEAIRAVFTTLADAFEWV